MQSCVHSFPDLRQYLNGLIKLGTTLGSPCSNPLMLHRGKLKPRAGETWPKSHSSLEAELGPEPRVPAQHSSALSQVPPSAKN